MTTSSDNIAPDRSWGNMVSIGSMMRTGALMNHAEDVLMYSFIKFSLQSIWADRSGKSVQKLWLAGWWRAQATCCEKSEVGAENGAFISPVPAASPGQADMSAMVHDVGNGEYKYIT